MRRTLLLAVLVLPAWEPAAHAYVGPGVGIGALATVLGILGSLVLWLGAVLWYPLKRMLRRRRPPANHVSGRAS